MDTSIVKYGYFEVNTIYPFTEGDNQSTGTEYNPLQASSFCELQKDVPPKTPERPVDVLMTNIINEIGEENRMRLEIDGKLPESMEALEAIAKPSHWAAKEGNKDLLELVVKAAATLSLQAGKFGRTPLHETVLRGDYEMSQYLIQNGACATAVDYAGNTPLDLLCQVKFACWEEGHTNCLKYLISKGARVDKVPQEGWGAPMHQLAGHGNCAALAIALKHAEDVNVTNIHGENVIHCFIRNFTSETPPEQLAKIVGVFAQRGGDLSSEDRNKYTWEKLYESRWNEGKKQNIPNKKTRNDEYRKLKRKLRGIINIYKKSHHHFGRVKEAIRWNLEPTELSDWPVSLDEVETIEQLETFFAPVHWTIAHNNPDLFWDAIQAGADVTVKEQKYGRTPLHIAAISGKSSALTYLLDKRFVNVNEPDNTGETALGLLCQVPTEKWTLVPSQLNFDN